MFLHHTFSYHLEYQPIHYWSFDNAGKTRIPKRRCQYFGLPTKFELKLHSFRQYSWPTEVYQNLHRWQVARGFDPTTRDFAHYLGY
ncbi:hypothetical protein L218DRAFT_829627, partial [Marasmius fiardii PR-910]